ncbi:hypothetical protein AcV5_009302 [Taiwanofungus camphoratus]|nr:hypothetical protein AcV5_009302 [Antrodia cinnamomea]
MSILASASPIARVPDDVMHSIFHLAAYEQFVAGAFAMPICVLVSHICRYWREIALASPQLWTFLSLTVTSNILMLDKLLERSKDALLSVRLTGFDSLEESGENHLRMVRVLSNHVGRFAEFYATGFHRQNMARVLSCFTCPAPQLRILQVHGGGGPHMRYFHVPRGLISFPAIFLGWMPSLRRVCIDEISMPWLPYRELTELVLCNQAAPSLSHLLETVRSSPFLRVLDLRLQGTLSQENPSVQSPISTIELAHLQRLSLESPQDARNVVHILTYLSFPTSTSVKLHFSSLPRSPFGIGQCCPSLQNIACRVQSATLKIQNVFNGNHNILLRSTGSPGTSIEVQWIWPQNDDMDRLRVSVIVFAALRLPVLQALTIITYTTALPEEQWYQILLAVPTITSLDVDVNQESAVVIFCNALARRHTDHTQAATLVCPNLTHLVISHMQDSQELVLETLRQCFHARTAMSASRLKSLDIKMAQTPERMISSLLVDKLKEVMNNVTIDDHNHLN